MPSFEERSGPLQGSWNCLFRFHMPPCQDQDQKQDEPELLNTSAEDTRFSAAITLCITDFLVAFGRETRMKNSIP
jgi:hypothetical protein